MGRNKIFHENDNQMRAGIAILTSDKIDFQSKAATIQSLYSNKGVSSEITIQ